MSTERYIKAVDISTDKVEDEVMIPAGELSSNPTNLLINSNFQIWQRYSNLLTITERARVTNLAAITTNKPHGYGVGDIVQIHSMSDDTYDDVEAELTYANETQFTFANTGSNETATAESGGMCLITSREVFCCDDADFLADRWYTLREGGYSVASRQTGVGLQIKTTTTDKFGIVQIVPAKELEPYINGKFSLSIDVKSDGTSKCKLALLSWGDETDSPTRDVVDVWGATDTNPTMVTDWTMDGVSDFTTLSSSLQTLSVEDVSLTSGTKNIALFLWVENTVEDELISINNAQILPSVSISSYSNESYLKELTKCLRFYQKSYKRDLPPFSISDIGKTVFPTSYGTDSGGYFGAITLSLMYRTPTITLITPNNPPVEDKWRLSVSSNSSVSADEVSESKFLLKNDELYTLSVNSIFGHYVAEAEI